MRGLRHSHISKAGRYPSPALPVRDAHIVLDAAQAGHPLPQLRWGRWPDRAGWGAASRAAPYAVGCDGRANRALSAAADHTPSGVARHLPRYAEKGSHWPLVSALPSKLWRPEMCASRSGSAREGGAGWGVVRCRDFGSDCTTVTVNLRRIIPAFRTPSGPPGHLPRSAEKEARGRSTRAQPHPPSRTPPGDRSPQRTGSGPARRSTR